MHRNQSEEDRVTDGARDRTEQELKAAKDYLRTVFNNIHDAIFVHDTTGKVIDVNDTMLEMYRCSRSDAIGRSILPDFSSSENLLFKYQHILWQRVLAGEDQRFEWKAKRPADGSTFDVEVSLTRLVLPQGNFILASSRDVTAQKRAEEELRAEKKKFQTITEDSPIAMVMIGLDGTFKHVNPKFLELFGHDLADLSNAQEWLRRVDPDLLDRVGARPRRLDCRNGDDRPCTMKVRCKDGTEKHINFRVVGLETGEIIMTCEDITKTKEAQDKIKQRNLELEVMNDIIATVTSSLRLSEMGQALKWAFAKKLEIPAGAVFFYDEEGRRLRMETSWGAGLPQDLETTGLAGVSSEVLVRPDGEDGTASLYVPLVVKDEIQGVVLLITEKAEEWSDDRVAFFKTLGQEIGVAMQNARLFEQVRQSHTHMRNLSLRLVEVQEAERRSIARELHDEIGQVLTGLKLSLEINALKPPGTNGDGLEAAISTVNKLVVLVRELSLNLRPAMLDDLGLLPTLHWHFGRFGSQTNIQVDFRHSGLEGVRFSREAETAVYRIVQEALTNVARHAGVNEVIVRSWFDGKALGVQIEDRGVGFEAERVLGKGNTSGLNGMRERALLLGGQFTVETDRGQGTRLTAELPVLEGRCDGPHQNSAR